LFSLTKQEKYVLIFLSALLLIGLSVSYFGKMGTQEKMGTPLKEHSGERGVPIFSKVPININKASLEELIILKGIGVKTAERIIEYRLSNGPFFCIEDIQNVKGIGPAKFNTIKTRITVN